jgi:hypothetical protein
MNGGPAKINTIGEKALITNLDQLRNNIYDRADLASASYLHPR